MTVSVVVPLNRDDALRTRNWEWLRARYRHFHPDWEIVEHADPADGPDWSKGRAVHAAVAVAAGDVLIVADADVFIEPEHLNCAVAALRNGAPWVIPHGVVRRLSPGCTATIVASSALVARAAPIVLRPGLLARPPRLGPCGGGLVVLSRAAWDAVGGIDPRFVGWGGEDISFARALDTLVGPHMRLGWPLWHLWHRPMTRRPGNRASPTSEALANRYLDAAGDPERMAALVVSG